MPKETSKNNGVMELPVETNEMSVARGFILTFISRLPGENGPTSFCHFLFA
jgi:hypothetical protein